MEQLWSLAMGIVTAIFCLYLFLIYQLGYWKRKGVFSPKSSIFGGHIGSTIRKKKHIALVLADIYKETKQHPYVGIYFPYSPVLVINDLDMVRTILTKDFNHFTDHGLTNNPVEDPLTHHLFNMEGAVWKAMRIKLTPTFTSSKMKYMFNTLLGCSKVMEDYLEAEALAGNEIDFREVLARYGTDVIGSCAFGIETNSFKYPDAEFRMMGKKIFEAFNKVPAMLSLFVPFLFKKLKLKLVPKEVEKFLVGTVSETIKYREKNNINRHDFLQLLIDMKKSDDANQSGSSLSIVEMTAQVFLFFAAGFETSSTTASYALYALAKNQDVQEKLYQEIKKTLKNNNGEITYESISEIEYLTQVIQESLRMYPPLPFLFRICTKNYVLPDTNVTIEKGTRVFIPIFGIQRDPKFFKNPDTFMPERFDPQNKSEILPFSNLSFGEGPRLCIGSRFGMMQVRLGLIAILSKYRISLSQESSQENFEPSGLLLAFKTAQKFKVTKRND